ncbi:UbiA family prenyltransferase [Parapedobacter sp.]
MRKLNILFRSVRAYDWWDYKLAGILAVAYATSMLSDTPLYQVAPDFIFLLVALAIGAIYVSVINDITDIQEDLAIGKRNHMARISPKYRWLIPGLCLTAGGVFSYVLWPDKLSLVLYLSAWVAFSLYSIPPFRFKSRGVLGVLADASGAHLFPTLFVVSRISVVTDQSIAMVWFASVGIWAFTFGLRGILWHQFMDRANDIQTNTTTLASKVDVHRFRRMVALIMTIELTALMIMLVYISEPVLFFLFPVYFVLVGIRFKKYNQLPISIIAPQDRPWQMMMLDFYQCFLPMGLLVSAVRVQPWAWVVLVIHIMLFHKIIFIVVRDFSTVFRWGYSKFLLAIKGMIYP